MINFEYFCLPALYVKDISSDVIHMVGTDAHDRLYLLSMDDGRHYLLDLNDKIIRRYDDFSKISDILKKEDV